MGGREWDGGAIYCSANDYVLIENTIFWRNSAEILTGQEYATQIYPANSYQSFIDMSYCCFQEYDSLSGVTEFNCGAGNIDVDSQSSNMVSAIPEFYDITISDSYSSNILLVSDASMYALGDIVDINNDNVPLLVIGIDLENNIVFTDEGSGIELDAGTSIRSWGKYAIYELDCTYEPYVLLYPGTIMSARPASNSTCFVDAGLDSGLPEDIADIDGDYYYLESLPLDLSWVSRIQFVKEGSSNGLDIGAIEYGGLVASDQNISTNEDTSVNFSLNVSSYGASSACQYIITMPPGHGEISSSGLDISYTPDLNYTGTDEFHYKAYDGENFSNVARVSITVNSVPDSPIAADDIAWVNFEASVSIAVLANDYDPDAGEEPILDTTLVSSPSYGTVTFDANDVITYQATSLSEGQDVFTYKIIDSSNPNLYDTGQVTVKFNHPPVADDDSEITAGNILAVIDVLDGDTDPDEGQEVGFSQVISNGDGEAVFNEQYNVLLYVPVVPGDPNTSQATYTATYQATDMWGSYSNTANVTISWASDLSEIADTDGDRICDWDEENIFNTNPRNPDTDDDGVLDYQELLDNTDPLNIFSGDTGPEPLPYSTCFANIQGYLDEESLHNINGWEVEAGSCNANYTVDEIPEQEDYEMGWTYAALESNTIIRKEFYDNDDVAYENSKIVRVKLAPRKDSIIKIYSDNFIKGAVKFREIEDGGQTIRKIYYYSGTNEPEDANWLNSNIAWEYGEDSSSSPYIRFETNAEAQRKIEYVDGLLTYTVLSFGEDANDLIPATVPLSTTSIELENQCSAENLLVYTVLVAGNDNLQGEIVYPCHCEHVSESRVPVTTDALVQDPEMNFYKLYYQAYEDYGTDIWHEADGPYLPGYRVGPVGYWNTGVIPNGLYNFKLLMFRGVFIRPNACSGPPKENQWCPLAESVAYHLAVSCPQKPGNFRHETDPLVSVPWPGQFPFEFRLTYDSANSKRPTPIEPAWTHNYYVNLVEDFTLFEVYEDGASTLTPYEDYSGGLGEDTTCDEHGLGFGVIYVNYEDGSRHMFRHRTGGIDTTEPTPSIYTPWPHDGSGDYIVRTSGDIIDDRVSSVTYSLFRRDGTIIDFEFVNGDDLPQDISQQYNVSNGEWVVSKSNGGSRLGFHSLMAAKTDRFDNTLQFSWTDGYKLEEINWPQGGKKIDLAYTEGDSGIASIGYYYKIESQILDNDGQYIADGGIYYYLTNMNKTFLVFPGKEYLEDGSLSDDAIQKVKLYIFWDWAPELMFGYGNASVDADAGFSTIADEDIEILKTIYYNDYGSVVLERDYQDDQSGLETYYYYEYFDPDGYDAGEDYEDPQWLYSNIQTPYTVTTSLNDERGRLRAQSVMSQNDGEHLPPKFVFYAYQDSAASPPFQPTHIYEYWYNLDVINLEWYRQARHTENSYERINEYGSYYNLTEQAVYDLDPDTNQESLVSRTEMTYHPYTYYNLPVSKTTYIDAQSSSGQTQTIYEYGLPDGTVALHTSGDDIGQENPADPANVYLISERTLLDTTSQNPLDDTPANFIWSNTEYTYLVDPNNNDYAPGLPEMKSVITYEDTADPNNNTYSYTFYNYDPNYYLPDLVSMNDVDDYSTAVPMERFYYNVKGQPTLKADNRGLVTYIKYDDFDQVYEKLTYHDSDALVCADFNGSRYDSRDFRTRTNSTYDCSGRPVYQRTLTREALDSYLGYYPGRDYTQYMADIAAAVRTTYNNASQPTMVEYDAGGDPAANAYTLYGYDNRGLEEWSIKRDPVSAQQVIVEHFYDDYGTRWGTRHWDYDFEYITKMVGTDNHGSGQKAFEAVWAQTESDFWELQGWSESQYDVLGRVISQSVGTDYDVETHSPTSAGLQTTYFTYNDIGQRISMTDPTGNTIYADYDRAGRKVTDYFATATATKYPRSVTTYNPDNSVAQVCQYDYPDASDNQELLSQTVYDYDALGRLTQTLELLDDNDTPANPADDIFAETSYEYHFAFEDEYIVDANSFSGVTITRHNLSPTDDIVNEMIYNEQGKVIRINYEAGDYQQTRYRGDGRIHQRLTFAAGGTGYWTKYDYDLFGRLSDTIYPGDTATDPNATGGTLNRVSRTYDGLGRLTCVTDNRQSSDNIGGTGQITYTYDPDGRVETVTQQDGYITSYRYRSDGQKFRVTVTAPGDPDDILYDVKYDYDAAGRLTDVSEPSLPFGSRELAGYGYDTNGNRDHLEYYLTGNAELDRVRVGYDYNLDNFLTGYQTTSHNLLSGNGPCLCDGRCRHKSRYRWSGPTD